MCHVAPTVLPLQVGVFFPLILLKPFEPPGGPGGPGNAGAGGAGGAGASAQPAPPPTSAQLQHRGTVLRILNEICRDGQLLVDVFVNYDCDLESSNLFERMVNSLVKVAQQPIVVGAHSAWGGMAWCGIACREEQGSQGLIMLCAAWGMGQPCLVAGGEDARVDLPCLGCTYCLLVSSPSP